MGTGAKFHKDWFSHSNVIGKWGYTAWWQLKPVLFFNKENTLIRNKLMPSLPTAVVLLSHILYRSDYCVMELGMRKPTQFRDVLHFTVRPSKFGTELGVFSIVRFTSSTQMIPLWNHLWTSVIPEEYKPNFVANAECGTGTPEISRKLVKPTAIPKLLYTWQGNAEVVSYHADMSFFRNVIQPHCLQTWRYWGEQR
jgi:hypothetical protein